MEEGETKQSYLTEAYNLAVDTLKTCMNLLGQSNVYSAKIYRFIGSLLYYMERYILTWRFSFFPQFG